MTNVTKEEYWTTILNDPTQIGQITTEDTEFNRRINDVNLVLSNTFINSSDENLISNWETSLYIDEIEGKTITERKADILYTLCEKNYVPVSIIKRFLLNLIGDENRFVVEFIKDENKLIVHTDRTDDTQFEAVTALLERVLPQNVEVVRYNHNMEISWRDINKYADCVTREDMLAVNPDYKNDFTSDGEWIYPLTKMMSCSDRNAKPPWYLFEGVTQKSFVTEMPEATNVYRMFHSSNFDEVRVTLPNFTSQMSGLIFGDAKIRRAVLVAPKWENMGWLCNGASIETLEIDAPVTRLDAMAPNKGKYILRNVKLTTTQLSTADGAFNSAQLTRESALHVLDILPTYTSGSHLLTIGIHIDHQNDEEVLEAIANAESKGWVLTIQWNGTPTSSASTMAMGSLIYAKASEMELPDGTTERVLNWGHYVTDETGYETFRSLESAYKYFNLEQPTEI